MLFPTSSVLLEPHSHCWNLGFLFSLCTTLGLQSMVGVKNYKIEIIAPGSRVYICKLDVVRKGVCFLFRILGIFISLAWPSCVYEKKNSGNRKWQEVFVLFKNLHAQRKVAFAFSTLLLYGPLLIYIGTAPISEVSIASTWEYGDQLGFCSFVLLLSGVASTAGIFALS